MAVNYSNIDALFVGAEREGRAFLFEHEVYAVLRELNQRLTIVLVTHDLGFVSTFVKSVICVNRRVTVHPTSEVTGAIISEIYGRDLKLVRHDHRCAEDGHQCLSSSANS